MTDVLRWDEGFWNDGVWDFVVADLFAARKGASAIRFRFEQRTKRFGFVANITDAVVKDSGKITLTNRSDGVMRTCTLRLLPSRLPVAFDAANAYVAIFMDVLAAPYDWRAYSLGLYRLDEPTESLATGIIQHSVHTDEHDTDVNEEIAVQGSDGLTELLTEQVSEPYLVPAGSDYGSVVASIFTARGFKTAIFAIGKQTPADIVFPAGTSMAKVASNLMLAVNWYPPYFDAIGVSQSFERTAPAGRSIDVVYDTESEPRLLLRRIATRKRTTARAINRVVVNVNDPLRSPFAASAQNNDVSSAISVPTLGAAHIKSMDVPWAYDVATAQDIAAWEIYQAVSDSKTITIETMLDPRRREHEVYRLRLESHENLTRWIVRSWTMELKLGGRMQHELGDASNVSQTLVEVGSV